jgi:hypothetical protein
MNQWQAPAGQCQAWDPSGQPCVLGHGHPGNHSTAAAVSATGRPSGIARGVFRVALLVWAVAYPVASCSPVLGDGGVGGAIALSAVLFFPWIIGIIILGVVVAVTRD